jgi:transposase, IS5 family
LFRPALDQIIDLSHPLVRLAALIQESLAVATKTGALSTKDLERVAVDTTVQPKAIARPTDARLTHRAIKMLVVFAKRHGIALRQSYLRLAKRAAIVVGRYTPAHQFKRANRELKFLRTRLGRLIRDINRKIAGDITLGERFHQHHCQRGQKVYSRHAVLAAVGFNFHLLLRWFAALLCAWILLRLTADQNAKPA